jgi:hypothetical protein
MVAEALDRLGQAPRLGVAALEEIVHARRFEAVPVAQRLLLAVEDALEPLAQLVGRAVHAVALLERAPLALELLLQLVDAHHAQVQPRHVEAELAHPLERLARGEALHHQARERVERALGVEREGLLRPVPAAVEARLHDRW